MKRRTRKIVILVVLLALIGLLGAWYANFRATKRLEFDFVKTTGQSIQPPNYLFSFNGGGGKRLQRPVGVLAVGETVYVADAKQGLIFRFGLKGQYLGTFGEKRLVAPLYIARHPKSGELYLSDRGTHTVLIFDTNGKYKREFKPNLPKKERPDFDTHGVEWAPVAIGFAPDGTMYVSEILKGHRVLMFGPDGKFVKSVGIAGIAKSALENPTFFQFPNNIKVRGKEVWVVDSNNRRVQIFDRNLAFQRVIDIGGLPRGLTFIKRSTESTAVENAVLVDTLAHDASIWTVDGELLLNFGQQGIAEGQFSYPGDVSAGRQNILYITDGVNERVQAWGWPEDISPLPKVTVPQYWGWCLTPLLLLPLLLLAKKKRYVATADFVYAIVEAGEARAMVMRRVQWLVTQDDYERLRDVEQDGVRMADLLEPAEYSESDVRALMDRLEIERDDAIVLAMAQRAKLLCTEGVELRRAARLLEIEVADHEAFLRKQENRRKSA